MASAVIRPLHRQTSTKLSENRGFSDKVNKEVPMYSCNCARLGMCLSLIFTSANAVSATKEITAQLAISGRVISVPCQTNLELDKLVATCNNNGEISTDTIKLTQLESKRATELNFAKLDYQWVDKANTMAIIKTSYH